MFENFLKMISETNMHSEIMDILVNDDDSMEHVHELAAKIKDGASKEDLFNSLIRECNNESASDAIIRIINCKIKPYEEMSFFRTMDFGEFKSVMDYMLTNTLINSELKSIIINHTNLSRDNYTYALRLLNTANQYIIIRRFTVNRFEKAIYDLFRFSKEKIYFLWELFNNNRQSLISAAILNGVSLCQDISDDLENLLDIITKSSMYDKKKLVVIGGS